MTTRITILGFTIPESDFRVLAQQDRGMPIQTHTFAWNLARSLVRAGADVTLLSTSPATNFPANRRLLFRGGEFDAERIPGKLIGFVNLLVLKHLSRMISCFFGGRRAISRWGTEVLLIHGVHSPFLWFGVALRRLNRIKVVPVLTDPPGVILPTDGRLSSWLKGLDRWMVKSALRRCDGVVALTSQLAADFAPGVPALTMEGFFEEPKAVAGDAEAAEPEILTIAYAGGLTRAYGVDRLVRAVRECSRADVRLRLFGRGELEDWIAEQAAADPRIQPAEFIDRAELQPKLRGMTVLVNPRPVGEEFVRYSFPSKIFEYIRAGVPVVTTRLPGIPADFDRFLVFAESDTCESLREAIERVLNMTHGDAKRLSEAAFQYARTTRSLEAQGARIETFAANVVAADAR